MWSLFRRQSQQTKSPSRKHASVRPRLEALEDRFLLTAGALDPTFGNGAGYVTTSMSNGNDYAQSVVVEPNGTTIVSGYVITLGNGSNTFNLGLAAYNPDGSPDTAFGSGGKVIGPAVGQAGKQTLVLYPSTDPNGNGGKLLVTGLYNGFLIARYNANGTLDATFGNGGIASANFGSTLGTQGAVVAIIQPDGKVVAAGEGNSNTAELARFNADGSLDTSFGNGGLATVANVKYVNQLLLQPDGSLLVTGPQVMAELNANGTLNTSFGSSGTGYVTNTSFASAVSGALGAVDPTGKTTNDQIVLIGLTNGSGIKMELARYNPDGTLDTTFGSGGMVFNSSSIGTQVAVQADGKIVALGGVNTSATEVSLARYNADGSLDTTFGSGGIVTTQIGSQTRGTGAADAIALEPNGDIVVRASSYDGSKWDFAVLRYLGDSPSFAVSGFPASATAGTTDSFTVTALNADGSVNTGYTGTVHFTSSDPKAVLPADYTFTAADQGVHTFSATLLTAGSQSLTATDTTNGTIVGGEAGIVVTPAAASQFILSAPSSVTHGTKFSVTLTVEDAYGNVVTGYVGTIHFSSSDKSATLPANYTFTTADAGVHTFSNAFILRTRGKQTLTATDTLNSSLTATDNITVN